MSYCLNPKCPNPADSSNSQREICRHCGTDLVIKGRYRIIRPLGGGGFGKTFEVSDGDTPKVLKVLYKNHPKAIELFKQEAVVLSRLQHPGIPKVEEDGYFTFQPRTFKEPLHCLVMEKINGSNLEEWLKERNNKALSEEELLECFKQLVEILDKVHQQQFFHRDIKPLNIMRRPNGQLVLIDFGAAREVTGTYLAKVGQGQNITGIVSPGYTPPEQVNGKAVPQSDFYALGRTLVFLVTGKPPTAFPENPRTGKLVWREHAPQISPELADIIDYMMAPFPGNRPQNAQMILQCLAEIDPNTPVKPQSGFTKRRNTGGIGSSSGNTGNSLNKDWARQTATVEKIKRASRRRKLKKLLKTGASLLLASLVGTQIFSFWRYGEFPANPLHVLISLPSSRFLEKNIRGKEKAVNALALLPITKDTKPEENLNFAIATGSSIQLWNAHTNRILHEFDKAHALPIRALIVSADGKRLFSGSSDKNIRIWNLERRNRFLTIAAHADAVNALAISRNGEILASGSSDKTIRLWLLPRGQRLLTIAGHDGAVNALTISPDNQRLVSGSSDKTIKIWDLNTGRLVRTLSGHRAGVLSVAISPDGKTLASGSSDSNVFLWQLTTGKQQSILTGHYSPVRAVAFSPDGNLLATGGDTIKLWELKTGKKIETLIGHSQPISSLVFSADSKTLLSGSLDGSVKIWRVPSREETR